MEEQKENIKHDISIKGRSECTLTGIYEVIQFNDRVLIVNTSMGRLEIGGMNLHVTGFDEKHGVLNLKGEINTLSYSDIKSVGKTTKGIIGRMFR